MKVAEPPFINVYIVLIAISQVLEDDELKYVENNTVTLHHSLTKKFVSSFLKTPYFAAYSIVGNIKLPMR